jgi:hypothetical protein
MQGVQNKCRTRLRHPDFYQTRRGSVLFGNSWPWLPLEWTASDIIVTSSRSKWAAGKAVRAGLAARGRISEWICNRRATQPPAHFQRNPSGSAGWLFFRVARSLRINLDILVARALKNSQLTCGDVIIICEMVH